MVVSPEMWKFAEAEFFPSNEGSMCAVAMRDDVAPPGSWITSCLEGHRWNQETRPGPPDWSPAGEDDEALPQSISELRSGVGLVHSTDDAVEGNETRRGKGPARGELAQGGWGPDAEPGRLSAGPGASERGGRQSRPGAVHRPAPPCRYRDARTSVPATEAAGKRGNRRDNGGDVSRNRNKSSPIIFFFC